METPDWPRTRVAVPAPERHLPDAIISHHCSMRFRRRIPVLLGLVIFLAAVFAVVELRKHAPPEPARLLPGADGFLYLNLQWMRRADVGGKLPAVPHDPDYEQFIRDTGFDFERDLAQAAFAIHYASPATHHETRFSEILVAHLEGEKFRTYLKKNAQSIEEYRAIEIYNVPVEDRIFRIAILGVDVCTPHLCTMVAASNHDDPAVIHGMVDRARKLASPFGGPALLRSFYRHVPQLPLPSLGWAIFKVNPSGPFSSPLFPAPATVVASVQYLGAVHFRAEAFTKNADTAKQLVAEASTFLNIFQSAEQSATGHQADADVEQVMQSIQIGQNDDRAILTAIVPSEVIRRIVAEAPATLSSQHK